MSDILFPVIIDSALDSPIIFDNQGDVTLIEDTTDTMLIIMDQQGPAGANGASDQIITSFISGIALSGHHAVCLDTSQQVIYADKDTFTHKNIVLGITTGASSISTNASIQAFGIMAEPSWAWSPEDTIYLGSNGLLTNVAPTTGFILILGFALSATQIFIDIKQPIILT